MTEFKVGDTVYIKDDRVKSCKRALESPLRRDRETLGTALASGQPYVVQIALAKDIPLTIIFKAGVSFYVTNFDDSWGMFQNGQRGFMWKNGKEYKTWCLLRYEIEKRERLNTISLHELNRGL